MLFVVVLHAFAVLVRSKEGTHNWINTFFHNHEEILVQNEWLILCCATSVCLCLSSSAGVCFTDWVPRIFCSRIYSHYTDAQRRLACGVDNVVNSKYIRQICHVRNIVEKRKEDDGGETTQLRYEENTRSELVLSAQIEEEFKPKGPWPCSLKRFLNCCSPLLCGDVHCQNKSASNTWRDRKLRQRRHPRIVPPPSFRLHPIRPTTELPNQSTSEVYRLI